MTIRVEEDCPKVTFLARIDPSPDWFVGVDSLSLRAGGEWQDNVAVDLFVYDAGTDSGLTYTALNQNTQPFEPIRQLTEAPFDNGVPVGQLRFELLSTAGSFPISGFQSGLYYDPQRDGEGSLILGRF